MDKQLLIFDQTLDFADVLIVGATYVRIDPRDGKYSIFTVLGQVQTELSQSVWYFGPLKLPELPKEKKPQFLRDIEWRDVGSHKFAARTAFGEALVYRREDHNASVRPWYYLHCGVTVGGFKTPEDAKNSCQTEHNARIGEWVKWE